MGCSLLPKLASVSVVTVIAFHSSVHSRPVEENSVNEIRSIVECLQEFNVQAVESYKKLKQHSDNSKLKKLCSKQIKTITDRELDLNLSSQASPLSFMESIFDSLDTSITLVEKSLDFSESIDVLNQEIAKRNPSITLSLESSFYSENYLGCTQNASTLIGTSCDAINSFEPYSKPQNSYQFGSTETPNIAITYDLLNIEQDMEIMSKKLNVKAEENNLKQTFQDFSKQVIEKLDEIIRAKQEILIQKSKEMLYLRSLEIAKYQLKIGFKTIVDIEKLNSNLLQAESSLESKISDYRTKIYEFRTFTSSSSFPIVNLFFTENLFKDLPIVNPSDLIEESILKNPQFSKLRFQLSMLGYSIRARKAQKYPTVSLSLGLGVEQTGSISQSTFLNNSSMSQYSGVVGLQWDLYNSGLTSSMVAQKEKELNKVHAQLNQLTISTSNEVISLIDRIKASNEEIYKISKAVNASEKAMLGTEQRLMTGFEDSTALIQTVQEYITAQTQLVDTITKGAKLYRELAFLTQNLEPIGLNKEIMSSFEQHIHHANNNKPVVTFQP